ncbi:MAG: glycoside hydrolase family 99-like domain-containing protein [Pseudomonadaceae bacterium]|nr:glycoside hydrolase family 99-like domain-containing protein [Pseudomonadaceae bacterium]
MKQKHIIAVLGMHRSGTSVITRGLQVLGVDLGDRLLPPEEGINDKGFWEDMDVTAFDVDLLSALGHDWHSFAPIMCSEFQGSIIDGFKLRAVQLMRDKLADIDVLGLKDPRMARLMPFWLDVFEHLGVTVSYVIACRNPMSVVHSLARRNDFPLEKSYLLWFEHMLLSVKHTGSAQRVFVDYDLMLRNPAQQLARIARSVGLPFVDGSPELVEYENEFLEHSLRRNDFAPEDLKLDRAAPADTLRLSALLSDLTSERIDDDSRVIEQVEALHASLLGRYPDHRLMQSMEDQGAQLSECLAAKDLSIGQLGERLNELSGSLELTHQQLDVANQQFSTLSAQQDLQARQLSLQENLLFAERARVIELEGVLAQRTAEKYQIQYALAVSRTGRSAVKSLIKALARRLGLGRLHMQHVRKRLMRSGLFDAEYYLATYPDVAAAGIDPLKHFLGGGWAEGRNPAEFFSTKAYLERYADVRISGVNPLLHYLKHGYREGRMVPSLSGTVSVLVPRRSFAQLVMHASRLVLARPDLAKKFFVEARSGGVRHAMALIQAAVQKPQQITLDDFSPCPMSERDAQLYDTFKVVPYYLDPYPYRDEPLSELTVAVHLHVFYADMTDECIGYLRNIPVAFDLFLSVPEGQDAALCAQRFRSELALAHKVIAEAVPNRGRDVAPFITQFGKRLAGYDVVGHFHTKKSPHKESLSGWFDTLMSSLCGSKSAVSQILGLFAKDAKVVYAAGNHIASWDNTGWSDNYSIAQALLAEHADFDINDFEHIEFPQGAMFWAKGGCLREFLSLPLAYEDFAEEPIAADATLAHALERLVLVFSTLHEGRNYRLESPQLSPESQPFFEEQYDYSGEIVHDSVKVLAYYLPQFHPTPENDAWHGKDFTEWTKVRAANPLFQGHYQQHVPHPDIGYYHLGSPEQLALQAQMMRQAGVHGMVFYHYWFSGRLILEMPAQMLLANPDIDMPFSFCWANENWTRRWDGNESEILLGQVYSKDDALDFIRYLMPFFKDKRYIKVDGRPVLFIYRPSAMEHVEDYLCIWREECVLNGVKPPYVVATLTRGAVSPAHYGMDAAVERPLQDWTGGAVADMRPKLKPYWPVNGSVLDYGEVADHYMHKELVKDCVLFRSLVPTWDNAARYGSEALALHRFTTPKFQEWLEHLIDYSVRELEVDRRFIVVNAWNEWAEGAHLEPDTRFGYGYLNSVGRALCDYSFNETRYLASRIDKRVVVKLKLADEVREWLAQDGDARHKFVHCLANSTIFKKSTVVVDDAVLVGQLFDLGADCALQSQASVDFTLNFDAPYVFPSTCIETLMLMALRHPGFSISASVLNDPDYCQDPHAVNFEITYWARSGMELRPEKTAVKGYKVAGKASCFRILPEQVDDAGEVKPLVSTVMRFHCKGDRELLVNALLSLIVQAGCRVRPFLAVQDVSDDDLVQLEAELARLPWVQGCEPVIRRYQSSDSSPDLRSLMLNETLKSVGRGYAAFLDYDDVLFPCAYQGLVKRLQRTGKNASFGRVYSTSVDAVTGLILKRNRTYEYGLSHAEFVRLNHAPLHSFMLDLDQIDLSKLHYYDDMKFMEDYYLTLQVFTPADTDWESLRNCEFIGDYVHRLGDFSNTLALSSEQDRTALLQDAHYMVCEGRITELRRTLAG